jgi:hypothetical protein
VLYLASDSITLALLLAPRRRCNHYEW